ncbi:hypothetical protein ACFQ14_09100 [Pseudahrensia aquimaris]|uniref:Yip1 domain-containing protein n=1 Tax=Pseudahrensia aquimaris TaxID=744461 RepID=A0ABW3FDM4_9HYPH
MDKLDQPVTDENAAPSNQNGVLFPYIVSWASAFMLFGVVTLLGFFLSILDGRAVSDEKLIQIVMISVFMPVIGVMCAFTIGLPGLGLMFWMRNAQIEPWYAYGGASILYACFCLKFVGNLGFPIAAPVVFWNLVLGAIGGMIFWAMTTSTSNRFTSIVQSFQFVVLSALAVLHRVKRR